MLQNVAILCIKYIFLYGKYSFSQKKMIQEKDILNRLKPIEKPRTEVLRASYGPMRDRAEKEAGDETEQLTVHLTWIKVAMFLHFKVHSVVRVWVCQTHWKLWPPQHVLHSHHREPVVPLVLPDENKVETFFSVFFFFFFNNNYGIGSSMGFIIVPVCFKWSLSLLCGTA